MRLPPPNALRAFEAAGRHESFARAAGGAVCWAAPVIPKGRKVPVYGLPVILPL